MLTNSNADIASVVVIVWYDNFILVNIPHPGSIECNAIQWHWNANAINQCPCDLSIPAFS
jgi:hypothetical protein